MIAAAATMLVDNYHSIVTALTVALDMQILANWCASYIGVLATLVLKLHWCSSCICSLAA